MVTLFNYDEKVKEKLFEYITEKGFSFESETILSNRPNAKRYIYSCGEANIVMDLSLWLSSKYILIKLNCDKGLMDDFFKEGCPKCGRKKLTPSSLMHFKNSSFAKKISDEVHMSYGGCWDLMGTFPPNWICKSCGFMWNNINELKLWSKKAQMGEDLFDINLVDFENAENGMVYKRINGIRTWESDNNSI